MINGDKVKFFIRDTCISCNSKNLSSIWSGNFSDPFIRENLRKDAYSADLEHLLADERFNAVRCRECQTTFHQRILTDYWIKKLYSEWIDEKQIEQYEGELSGHGRLGNTEASRQFIKHCLRIEHCLGNLTDEKIVLLDFGCGDGDFLKVADAYGFNCFGIDFSSSRERRAKKNAIRFFRGLDDYDESTNLQLDAVTMFEVLEHLPSPLDTLKSLAVRMKPGGVLLLEVPDCSQIDVPSSRDEYHKFHPLEHINNFTPDTLSKICQSAGFIPQKRIPAHVTTEIKKLVKTELSRFYNPARTSAYFKLSI